MTEAAARGEDFLELDRQFHLTLMQPLANDLIEQLTGAFWEVQAIVAPSSGRARRTSRRPRACTSRSSMLPRPATPQPAQPRSPPTTHRSADSSPAVARPDRSQCAHDANGDAQTSISTHTVAGVIFKAVGDTRPYPEHGYSTRQWSNVPPRLVRLDDLVTTKRTLDLGMLLSEDSTFYGDLFAHVVEFEGTLYLEDGLHRALRAALHQRPTLHARVLVIE